MTKKNLAKYIYIYVYTYLYVDIHINYVMKNILQNKNTLLFWTNPLNIYMIHKKKKSNV